MERINPIMFSKTVEFLNKQTIEVINAIKPITPQIIDMTKIVPKNPPAVFAI